MPTVTSLFETMARVMMRCKNMNFVTSFLQAKSSVHDEPFCTAWYIVSAIKFTQEIAYTNLFRDLDV
jgi:hypothetical protein